MPESNRPRDDPVPAVTVVIPTRNRADYVRQAIESVLAVGQEAVETASLEIVVVDDGSTDDTPRVLASYPVRVVTGPGKGPGAARNRGIVASTTPYIAFLDDDDVWLPGHVVPHVRTLEATPTFAFAYSQGVLADERLEPVWHPTPSPPLPSGDIRRFLLDNVIPLNNLIVRRSVLEDVGLFDERLVLGPEDWELEFRIAARYPCAGIERVTTKYRVWRRPHQGWAAQRHTWEARFRSNLHVHRKAMRECGLRFSAVERLRREVESRGWFAYQLLDASLEAASTGGQLASLDLLGAALRMSPAHAPKTLVRYSRARLSRRQRLTAQPELDDG